MAAMGVTFGQCGSIRTKAAIAITDTTKKKRGVSLFKFIRINLNYFFADKNIKNPLT